MEVIILKDYDSISKKGAEIVIEAVNAKSDLVLGLATGSTPLGMYKEIIDSFNAGEVDLSNVTTFNLDEYCGLFPEHPQSYNYYMHTNLFKHVNIDPDKINLPNGMAKDFNEECRSYDEKIRRVGGIDLQVLGIGVNGHIGFNEPGTDYGSETQIVKLAKETIEANSRFFENVGDVPTTAISMGLKSIMRSKRILLLASGNNKASAIFNTIKGPVDPQVPASILQLHPDVIIVLDREAADLLMEEHGDLDDKEIRFSL